jgi:antitoxin component YwqK of YwqJK toxin-antitoxin module
MIFVLKGINTFTMRLLFLLLTFISLNSYSQCKTYTIGAKGDTLNCIDKKDLKQGKWVIHYDQLRGEPGFEEEGEYKDGRKEGVWRIYNLDGDLTGVEFFRWGNKDGVCQYFTKTGELVREESWKALNPDKLYDTLEVEDVDNLEHYKTVIVKNEGAGIRHGEWKYYDAITGMIYKTETYELGKLIIPKTLPKNSVASNDSTKSVTKPKEVKDFEKKNAGKKKVKYVDGSVQY